MPYTLRTFKCPDCSAEFTRRRPAEWPGSCVPCSVQHSADNARQLAAHAGPRYQRWQWAFATAVRRMAKEIAPFGVDRAA